MTAAEPLARYKDLCIDAVDPDAMAAFWATALQLALHQDGARLVGRTPQETIWFNGVAEPKTVKHRLHLDIHGSRDSEQELIAAGATVVARLPRWTVLADPEGGEFCLFVRDEPPRQRIYELGLNAADAASTAAWWARVLGVTVHPEDGLCWLEVPGAPFESIDVIPVPEPKLVKNRVHLDVVTPDLSALLAAGATMLRARDDEIGWNVLADPEGNEFCAFTAG